MMACVPSNPTMLPLARPPLATASDPPLITIVLIVAPLTRSVTPDGDDSRAARADSKAGRGATGQDHCAAAVENCCIGRRTTHPLVFLITLGVDFE
jgi:hypothetical protein